MNPSPGFIGFDGAGTSYSAQGLAADGLTPGAAVSAGGQSFTWPNVASAQPDNTMAEGQTIAGLGAGASLGFLAAANNSAESGTGTVYYTDGTTQPFTLSVGNFWYASGQSGNPSNTQVAGGELRQLPDRLLGAHGVPIRAERAAQDSGKRLRPSPCPTSAASAATTRPCTSSPSRSAESDPRVTHAPRPRGTNWRTALSDTGPALADARRLAARRLQHRPRSRLRQPAVAVPTRPSHRLAALSPAQTSPRRTAGSRDAGPG